MRKLMSQEIEKFSQRPGVRTIAVENFLGTMGTDRQAAVANLEADAKSYGWPYATRQAISDGIDFASWTVDDDDLMRVPLQDQSLTKETTPLNLNVVDGRYHFMLYRDPGRQTIYRTRRYGNHPKDFTYACERCAFVRSEGMKLTSLRP